MDRASFSMGIAPEHVSKYVWMHRNPWPELLRALDRSGWRNYSLFLSDERLLVGYLEADDWPAASKAMAAETVSAAWTVEMDPLVSPALPLVYTRPIAMGVDVAAPANPRRRCAMVGASQTEPRSLIAELEASIDSASWSNLVLIDTWFGTALYGEHPTDVEPPWPIGDAQELAPVFCLPELLAALEGNRS